MLLYAISRARVQYIGSCIPLFRFKHSLFEALITSIFENEMRPSAEEERLINVDLNKNSADNYFAFCNSNEVLQVPIIQERFLLTKFLEFMSHPCLK